MAKWWKLGFGKKDKGAQEEGAQPEPTPQAPAAPAPAPEKKPRFGGLGRLFGRGKKKEKEEAPEAPAAPAPPPGEAAPTEVHPAAPAGGEGAGTAEPGVRTYPSFVHVSADGTWVISRTTWDGIMSGTLHGSDVQTYFEALEGGAWSVVIPLIAEAYGIPGGLIDVDASTIRSVHPSAG